MVNGRRKFWHRKVVLVTGITGFVGSALAKKLVELHAKVVGLMPYEKRKSNFYRLGLHKQVIKVRGNLEDYRLLARTLRKYPLQIVYHLGAQAIVGKANQSPIPTFKTNVEGTWNLLEACRKEGKKIEAIVVASSDKAYGTHKKLPYREDYPLQPEYPYDVSKACADLIARSYHKTYGLPIVVTRFANIYGPGDFNFSRIVPDTIQSVLRGKQPIIRSDGTPERDYLYIQDVVDLYLLFAEKIEKTKGEVFNAGHNNPVSVLNMVHTILSVAGQQDLKPIILGKGKLHGEIDRQWLDGGKVKAKLQWKPRVKLKKGLQKSIEWHKKIMKRK